MAEGKTVLDSHHAATIPPPGSRWTFTIAPAVAITKLFERTKTTAGDVDLWEINEAFAVVAIANNQILKLDPNKVNIRGGATSLGHPIGASGARVLATLLHPFEGHRKKRRLVSICLGGGEGTALMVEP